LRALAIRAEWEKFIMDYALGPNDPPNALEILKSVEVRCYSAGQTIPPSPIGKGEIHAEIFRKESRGARRIEMRLTRLKNDRNDGGVPKIGKGFDLKEEEE
jgi:hypothetical protein